MTAASEDAWYDAEAGPLVRLYAITGGRTESPAGDFTLGAIVQRMPRARPDGELSQEQAAIVRLAEQPVSVSELAARLGLPLGTIRVILGDLRSAGLIHVPPALGDDEKPSLEQMQRLLKGLNAL
jgi:predicted Rossmann fold nucleotide-binding protein DprA/Smf involved in DNA uptake